MTTPPQQIRHLFRDATALVRVVAPEDFLEGLTAIPERLATGVAAVTIGPGDDLAVEYGCRRGQAFLFDAAAFTSMSGDRLAADIHRVALHEAGHMLTLPASRPEGVAAAVERLHDRSNKAAGLVAEQHNARWAVAYWAMAHRAVAYRRRYGAAIMAGVTRDVERYGHPHRIVAAHAERLDTNRSLRQILQPGGAVAQLVERVLPGATARADIVARDGNLTATGAA